MVYHHLYSVYRDYSTQGVVVYYHLYMHTVYRDYGTHTVSICIVGPMGSVYLHPFNSNASTTSSVGLVLILLLLLFLFPGKLPYDSRKHH